jgi:hypothetical protein
MKNDKVFWLYQIKLLLLFYLLNIISNVNGDFLLEQKLREENRMRPPLNPFFNTFYDKSYYYQGIQQPVYHVKFTMNKN